MDRQAVFDKIRRHLKKQGRRSEKLPLFCAYRNEDGLKCAIGCLITDEFYTQNLEGQAIEANAVLKAVAASLGTTLSKKDKDFLGELQTIHDEVHPDDWEDRFEDLADRYDLKLTSLRESDNS